MYQHPPLLAAARPTSYRPASVAGTVLSYTKPSGRRLLQVSLKPEFYAQVQQHCHEIDVPMALWVRSLIQREIAVPGNVEHSSPSGEAA